jgi:hypothetical protein
MSGFRKKSRRVCIGARSFVHALLQPLKPLLQRQNRNGSSHAHESSVDATDGHTQGGTQGMKITRVDGRGYSSGPARGRPCRRSRRSDPGRWAPAALQRRRWPMHASKDTGSHWPCNNLSLARPVSRAAADPSSQHSHQMLGRMPGPMPGRDPDMPLLGRCSRKHSMLLPDEASRAQTPPRRAGRPASK